MAEWTGLEPATLDVTGRYSNQLNYHSVSPIFLNRSLFREARSLHRSAVFCNFFHRPKKSRMRIDEQQRGRTIKSDEESGKCRQKSVRKRSAAVRKRGRSAVGADEKQRIKQKPVKVRNFNRLHGILVGAQRLELWTDGLRVRCSTN